MELYECEDRDQEIEVMQRMINDGSAWKMEGSTGRAAMAMLESGECILGTEAHYDAYGNRVPSRTEVKSGTKGSVEYAENMGV